MSVSRDYTPHTYSGDGAQTAFPVRWVFHDPAWVRAQRIVDGVATDLANGTDYTLQQGVDVGGTLTLTAPLAAGAKLLIWRDVPFEQLDRYTNTGLFDVRVVERGMDRLTVMAQQLREAVGRCVQVRMDSTTRPDQIMDDINSALAVAQASVGAAAGSATAAGVAKDGAEVARAGAEAAKAGGGGSTGQGGKPHPAHPCRRGRRQGRGCIGGRRVRAGRREALSRRNAPAVSAVDGPHGLDEGHDRQRQGAARGFRGGGEWWRHGFLFNF